MLFVCSVAWLFLLVVSTSASNWLERLLSKMTYNVLMGTLNPTQSLTHSLIHSLRTSQWVVKACDAWWTMVRDSEPPCSRWVQSWMLSFLPQECTKWTWRIGRVPTNEAAQSTRPVLGDVLGNCMSSECTAVCCCALWRERCWASVNFIWWCTDVVLVCEALIVLLTCTCETDVHLGTVTSLWCVIWAVQVHQANHSTGEPIIVQVSQS